MGHILHQSWNRSTTSTAECAAGCTMTVVEHRRLPAHALRQLGWAAQQCRPRRRAVQLLQVPLLALPAQLGAQLVRRQPDQPVRQRVGQLAASLHPRGRQPPGQVGVQQRHRGHQLGDVAQRAPRARPDSSHTALCWASSATAARAAAAQASSPPPGSSLGARNAGNVGSARSASASTWAGSLTSCTARGASTPALGPVSRPVRARTSPTTASGVNP